MADSAIASEFIQAQHFTATTGRAIRRVVMHSMENNDKPGTARGVALWFAGRTKDPAPVASATYCCDGSGPAVVQCVREQDVAYGAPGANRDGIHVELAGTAKMSTAEWEADGALLRIAAELVADVLTRYGLPAAFVDAEGLLVDEPGVTTHHEVTKACRLAKERHLASSQYFAAKNNHVDPGDGFPMRHFLELAQDCIDGVNAPALP